MNDRLANDDPQLLAELQRDEGYAKSLPNGDCAAYPDPLSGGDPWTIGFGHTGPEVKPGVVFTRAQAQIALCWDVATATRALDAAEPWWRTMSLPRQRVLVNMAFNLGIKRLTGFHNTLAAMQAGRFKDAANGMRSSMWARQVGARAERLAKMMEAG